MNLDEIKLKYTPPNFEKEWDEAQRYPELADMGKDLWISIAKHGRKVRLSSLGDVSNMDPDINGLESDKVNRAKSSFSQRIIELPIVVRINSENDLLAGNTRIAYLLVHDIDPFVWFIKVDDVFNNFDK